jgi:hypothetical protein
MFNKSTNILSLNAAGSSFTLYIAILHYYERRTCKNIIEEFDYILGSSSGGLLSLLLAIQNEDKQPKYNLYQTYKIVKDLLNFQEKSCSNFWHSIISGFGIFSPKCDRTELDLLIKEIFDNKTANDTGVAPLVISLFLNTSSSIYRSEGYSFFYDKNSPLMDSSMNYNLSDAASATLSLPVAFQAYNNEHLDGGLISLNPLLYLHKILEYRPDLEYNDLEVLNLGSMNRYRNEDVASIYKNSGLWNLATSEYDISWHSSVAQMRVIEDLFKGLLKERYHGFTINLDETLTYAHVDTYNTKELECHNLELGLTYIKDNKEQLDNALMSLLKDKELPDQACVKSEWEDLYDKCDLKTLYNDLITKHETIMGECREESDTLI